MRLQHLIAIAAVLSGCTRAPEGHHSTATAAPASKWKGEYALAASTTCPAGILYAQVAFAYASQSVLRAEVVEGPSHQLIVFLPADAPAETGAVFCRLMPGESAGNRDRLHVKVDYDSKYERQPVLVRVLGGAVFVEPEPGG